MAKMCICEFCGKEVKTNAEISFRHCKVEQEIETHLKRPKNNNKAIINTRKKKSVVEPLKKSIQTPEPEGLSKNSGSNDMEEENKKEDVAEKDILPDEPDPDLTDPEPDPAPDKEEVEENYCSECGAILQGDETKCPNCDLEFE